MKGTSFINQFKNTRRLACRLGRRPLGGQAKLQAGKKNKNAVGERQRPGAAWRSKDKFPGGRER